MLYPSASFQLTQDRGIKLFEVTKAVAALNTECGASSPDGRDKKLLLNSHAVLQIFSKEARVERRRKLKVHLQQMVLFWEVFLVADPSLKSIILHSGRHATWLLR